MEPIPQETAVQICEEIRREKTRRWFTQCGGCVRFSKGVPAKMCFASRLDNRGCGLVNELHDEKSPTRFT